MRMAIDGNHVVDNLHAGGIAAAVDLDAGTLGPASDLGADVRSAGSSDIRGPALRLSARGYRCGRM